LAIAIALSLLQGNFGFLGSGIRPIDRIENAHGKSAETGWPSKGRLECQNQVALPPDAGLGEDAFDLRSDGLPKQTVAA
jgi:hypothetical protein